MHKNYVVYNNPAGALWIKQMILSVCCSKKWSVFKEEPIQHKVIFKSEYYISPGQTNPEPEG